MAVQPFYIPCFFMLIPSIALYSQPTIYPVFVIMQLMMFYGKTLRGPDTGRRRCGLSQSTGHCALAIGVKHLQSPPCFWVLLRRKRGQVRREEVQLRKEEMQVRRRGGQVLQGRSSAPEGEEGRHRGVRALASAYVLRPWTGSALVFRRSGVMTEE